MFCRKMTTNPLKEQKNTHLKFKSLVVNKYLGTYVQLNCVQQKMAHSLIMFDHGFLLSLLREKINIFSIFRKVSNLP